MAGNVLDVKRCMEIIANLFPLTHDAGIKTVLSKYNLTVNDEINFKNLKKLGVDILKTTAQFLNQDKPVILLKDTLIQWIINRIKNLLPDTCTMCNQQYAIDIADKPPMTCYNCGQGIHETCFSAKLGLMDKLPDIPGLHWLCNYCDKSTTKNQINKQAPFETPVGAINITTDLVDTTTTETPSVTRTENPQQTDTEAETSHETAQENNKKDDRPICIHYRRNRCKHGISGRDCTFRHPKRCKRYISYGNDARLGCQKGAKCENFHPQLCRNSLADKQCFDENCKFPHCKGTKRIKPRQDNNLNRIQGNKKPYTLTNQQEFPNLSDTTPPAAPIITQPSSNTENHFLGVLTQIQQQLRVMESTQQQHALQLQEMLRVNKTQYQPIGQSYQMAPNTTMTYQPPTGYQTTVQQQC